MRTHLDLFSGIGGFAIAAQANGFTTIAFCEIDPYAQQVLIEKFGAVPESKKTIGQRRGNSRPRWNGPSDIHPTLHSDIFSLNGRNYHGVSLLTGGFPCQPFSLAGKRRGSADDRALWPEMFRVIREAEPAAVLAENVPGIINMELDRCLSDLESIGYACWPIVVPACAVDAKHRRDRVWIVAHSKRDGWGPRRSKCSGQERESSPVHAGNNVADASREQDRGLQQRRIQSNTGNAGDRVGQACVWLSEPDVGRVAHGIPARSHRLRALGNAIVPQVAQEIIRCMFQDGNS